MWAVVNTSLHQYLWALINWVQFQLNMLGRVVRLLDWQINKVYFSTVTSIWIFDWFRQIWWLHMSSLNFGQPDFGCWGNVFQCMSNTNFAIFTTASWHLCKHLFWDLHEFWSIYKKIWNKGGSPDKKGIIITKSGFTQLVGYNCLVHHEYSERIVSVFAWMWMLTGLTWGQLDGQPGLKDRSNVADPLG